MSIIENFIVASNSSTSLEELFGHLSTAYLALGYETACYFLLNDHLSMNRKAQYGVVSSYSSEWMNYYVERNFPRCDPLLRYCFLMPRAFSWETLLEQKIPEVGLNFVDDMKYNTHLVDGVGVPIHGPYSEVACFALASTSKINPDANLLSIIQAVAVQFHITYGRMGEAAPPILEPLILTEREREILMWSAEGKSVSTIAEILSTSENTVKYHLKKLYRKFDVGDRLQAVVKAM